MIARINRNECFLCRFQSKLIFAINLKMGLAMDKDEYKKYDMVALIVGAVIIIYALIMAFVFP